MDETHFSHSDKGQSLSGRGIEDDTNGISDWSIWRDTILWIIYRGELEDLKETYSNINRAIISFFLLRSTL